MRRRLALALQVAACGPAPVTPAEPTVVNLPSPPPTPSVEQTAPARPLSTDVESLGVKWLALARQRVPIVQRMHQQGVATTSEMIAAYRDVAVAAREAGLQGDSLRAALREYHDALTKLREYVKQRVSMGAESQDGVAAVEVHLVEAEVWLAQEKAGTQR